MEALKVFVTPMLQVRLIWLAGVCEGYGTEAGAHHHKPILLMSPSVWRVKVANAFIFSVTFTSPRRFNSLPLTAALSRYRALKPPLVAGSIICRPGAPFSSFIRTKPPLESMMLGLMVAPETAGDVQPPA